MARTKIGQGYYQNGYGKGFIKSPNIWLIDGKAWAKHQRGYDLLFDQASALPGYVPVNYTAGYQTFHALGAMEDHEYYKGPGANTKPLAEDEQERVAHKQTGKLGTTKGRAHQFNYWLVQWDGSDTLERVYGGDLDLISSDPLSLSAQLAILRQEYKAVENYLETIEDHYYSLLEQEYLPKLNNATTEQELVEVRRATTGHDIGITGFWWRRKIRAKAQELGINFI